MKLIKQVVGIGNGAAVYVPKEYSGKEVVVILPETIEAVKKRLLRGLIEFMPNVLGIYLYGSYARNEEEKDSDVDILIIVEEKNEKMKNLFQDIDVRVVALEGIKNSIKSLPALIMPILKESKVIMNPLLLEELKSSKINYRRFRWNFEDIRRVIKIIQSFIEIDSKDISTSHIYSLIMRIRVCYMIETLLKNQAFSNKGVKKTLLSYGLKETEIEKFFYIYRTIREDREVNLKVNKEEVLNLIHILETYLKKLEDETKKKIEKRN